jgi:hypothetical protein
MDAPEPNMSFPSPPTRAPASHAQAAPRTVAVRAKRLPVSERRARLVVQCACELLGVDPATVSGDLHLMLSVEEFEQALRERYAVTHPQLIYRTDSTLERARLERARLPRLPRVVLRRGAPPGRRSQPEG